LIIDFADYELLLRFILRQPITAYGFVVLFGSAETLPDLCISLCTKETRGYLPAGVMPMIVRPDLRRNKGAVEPIIYR
jgi:hypothetical protein